MNERAETTKTTSLGSPGHYRYRQLAPEERAEVVHQRLSRGYPAHAPPHPFRHAGHYLITAVNYEHAPIMASIRRRTNFEMELLQQTVEAGIDICAWVVLPNHYHVLVGVESLNQVTAMLKQLHGSTSRSWNLADGLTGRRKVWYKYHDRVIRNEEHYFRALNYVHFNPVKHGYVEDPYDWPWASLENYVRHKGREWLRSLWRSYPPRDYGAGWDD